MQGWVRTCGGGGLHYYWRAKEKNHFSCRCLVTTPYGIAAPVCEPRTSRSRWDPVAPDVLACVGPTRSSIASCSCLGGAPPSRSVVDRTSCLCCDLSQELVPHCWGPERSSHGNRMHSRSGVSHGRCLSVLVNVERSLLYVPVKLIIVDEIDEQSNQYQWCIFTIVTNNSFDQWLVINQ